MQGTGREHEWAVPGGLPDSTAGDSGPWVHALQGHDGSSKLIVHEGFCVQGGAFLLRARLGEPCLCRGLATGDRAARADRRQAGAVDIGH